MVLIVLSVVLYQLGEEGGEGRGGEGRGVHFVYLIYVHLQFPVQRGFTSLHLASGKGHENVVTILLESGSDIHAVTEVSAVQITTFNCTPTSSEYTFSLTMDASSTMYR